MESQNNLPKLEGQLVFSGDTILNPFTLHTYRVTGIAADGTAWMRRRKISRDGVELIGPYVKLNEKKHQRNR